ncbi:uncharacterized protein EI90DRAFT_3050297 [Cantharellus anzutake]|uniref:uncharacterized protein n=1 Tax=Cantharellus anzutake TaxID=1750568 RepID=UPI001907783C|nr:uncharacterized protein EI90DRAFT_3096605 [Cantharellus anzutake]XP_038917662.1 uncharacterized protein EI90DRAFT_3050297 [Cantharellus anzutake]KAF8311420.1 hypothetical protein EI90DRAFT_3096605 [Cantharellus anzutake]KAF8333920.1 hypothetical protein EI90DRAFT_3050297 [Cantharellus anzutake]
MDIAGYRHSTHDESGTYDTSDGVQKVNDVIERSLKGNFLGPVLSAVALIPLLLRKPTLSGSPSPSPSILLLSSIAGAIPAPTRSIYASTKSASLVFFQSLSIEWSSKLDFSIILPGSIEGDDFRKKAVDLDLNPAPESSTSMSTSMGTTSPRELEGPEETVRTPEGRGNETGVSTQLRREGKKLRREDVARACIDVIDWKRKGTITNIVWLPSWPYRYAHLVYWWAFRGFVERGAKKKYGFVH